MNNKAFLSLILFISLALLFSYRYSKDINHYFLSYLSFFKSSYLSLNDFIRNSIEEHFDQVNTIKKYRQNIIHYNNDRLIFFKTYNQLKQIYREYNSSFRVNTSVQLVRTISYAKLNDFTKVWLSMKNFEEDKVYALISGSYAAGIVIIKDKKPLALLNSDLKSSYAVYVGKSLAPGIIKGKNKDYMIVEYIPSYNPIKVGDEVITSGLDNIFFYGIKVGRVIRVSLANGYQSAYVKPYYDNVVSSYFQVIINK